MHEEYKQLGEEYKRSRMLIKNRIDELKTERAALERKMTRTKKSERGEVESRIFSIGERLRPLNAMYRDLSEIGREAANYYERGWWRSEKYTLNARFTRLPTIYYGFIEYEEWDEPAGNS